MRSPRRRPEPADASAPSAAATATIRRLRTQLHTERALLRQAQADLQLAAQRFRSVFDQQFQFMVILSPQGHVTEISEQLAMRDGAVPADRIIGRLFWETVWWEHVPEARTIWLGRLKQAALADGPLLNEDVFNSSSGEMRVASAAITAVKNSAGKVDCFVVQATDITDRRRAESQRQGLEAQLRETHKMQAIGTLAGGIAHDFNNILGGLLGNAALAADHLAADHPARAQLQQVQRAGQRARSLVQQILAFSRRQTQPVAQQRHALRPLVDETTALLRATLPAGVQLVATAADETIEIDCDATQIQQVLMNLCTNAWHALAGEPGRISVLLDRVDFGRDDPARPIRLAAGPYAHLQISDTGSGMDDSTRARIFEPFFTTKPVGQGTGLGLSVVHGIVAAHQGEIVVHSQPGQGSCFDVYLPLADPLGAAEAPRPVAPGPVGQGQHVLYVDDDEVMLLMVGQLLERAGYRISGLARVAEALAALREAPLAFDLVVTDLNMPDGSGLDVARAALHQRPDRPVVLSSGYVSDGSRAEAAALGVRAILLKEHTLEELPALVGRLLTAAPAPPAPPALQTPPA